MMQKKIIILGSTGSIGQSALKVVRNLPERFQIVGLAARERANALAEQAKEMGVKHLCLCDEEKAVHLRSLVSDKVNVFSKREGLVELIESTEADMVLVSIVGTGRA